jgi:hypothetical protein
MIDKRLERDAMLAVARISRGSEEAVPKAFDSLKSLLSDVLFSSPYRMVGRDMRDAVKVEIPGRGVDPVDLVPLSFEKETVADSAVPAPRGDTVRHLPGR